jgi:hypothetical protein
LAYDSLNEFINKQHTSIKEVIDDFWESQSDFLLEADEEEPASDAPEDAPDLDPAKDAESDGETPEDPDKPAEEKAKEDDPEKAEFEDDVNKLDKLEEPGKKEKTQKKSKETFSNNLRQVRQLKDYLDIAIERTNDKHLIKMRYDLVSLLNSIITIGEDILTRDNLDDINYDLEIYIDELVMNAKNILNKYINDNEKNNIKINQDMEDTSDAIGMDREPDEKVTINFSNINNNKQTSAFSQEKNKFLSYVRPQI